MAYLNCDNTAKTTKLDPKLAKSVSRDLKIHKFNTNSMCEGEEQPPLKMKNKNMHWISPPSTKSKIKRALTDGHTQNIECRGGTPLPHNCRTYSGRVLK
jgi:hypothetical protein